MTGLRFVAERIGEGAGQPALDIENGEELLHVQPNVSIVLGNHPSESPGTLYITTKQVMWLSDTDSGKGYAADFSSVSLHAVSRDPEAYPTPCIYTQIDTGAEDDESEDSDSECNETLDLSRITEMRLVPADPNQLDRLFEVFCEGAELNPDPIEEEEHNWIFSADQMEHEAPEDEESELLASQNPSNLIGCSNGGHDLAHTVLQHRMKQSKWGRKERIGKMVQLRKE